MKSRNTRTCKPRLEILEDRCVPATRTWDGGALSNNWSNASNWVGNIAPVAGDDLVFPAGNFDKTADNDYAHGTHFRSITLGGGYTLRGNRIFLGEGGVIDNSGTSNIIKNDLDFGSEVNRNIQVGSGSTLFIDGVISGSSGLTKLGTGNLSLRSNNTYTGITSINTGGLFIEKDEALGVGPAGTNILTGATLVMNDTGLGALRVGENLFVQNNGTLRGINDVVLQGTITTLGTTHVRHDGSVLEEMKLSGLITGAGGLSISSGSRVKINGEVGNQYQGTTVVSGFLMLATQGRAISGNLTILAGGDVRLDANDQISDSSHVVVNSSGFLALNATSDLIHSLTINGGVVFGLKDTFRGLFLDAFTGAFEISKLTIAGELYATSSSPSQSAYIDSVELKFQGTTPEIQVLNGPAMDDLIINYSNMPDVLHKSGPGTLLDATHRGLITVVNGDFTTDNRVVIEEGLVRFTNNLGDTEIVVQENGRFSSDDMIKGLTVQTGGRIRPGSTSSSTGIMKVKNDLTLEAGAIIEAHFNGVNAGSQHDQIDVEGTVDIKGAILEATLGSNAAVGQTYKLINNSASDAILGAFFLPPTTAPFLTASPTGQRLAFNYQGGLGNNDLVLTLQNTPPKAPDLALNSTEINEGGTVTATGSLVDPDRSDKLRLFINWGDGSRREVHRPGRDFFSFTHRYRQNGVYTARFEWIDQTGQGNSQEFTITVNNVAPAFKLRTFRTFNTGLMQFSGWLSDAGDDRYTATLDFGDGTSRSKTLKRRDYFAIAHKYRNPGNYTLTLTLRDSHGAESVFQREVIIS